MIGSRTALAFAACMAAGAPALAQEVNLAIPVVSLTVSPVYLADELGYFSKAGLTMKFPYIPGVGVNNALAAGSVEFAFSSAPTVIRGYARDQKAVIVAVTSDRIILEIALSKAAAQAAGVTETSPIEKRAQALKGRTIAVNSFNSVVHSFLKFVARKGGVDPDRDIKVTNAQGPVMLASLKSNAIDGFVLSPPWPRIPVHDGTAITLFSGPRGDFPELQPFIYTVVIARPDYCDKNASICERFVRGLGQAYTYIHEHPKEAIVLLKKRLPVDVAPEVFQAAFDLVRASTPKSPRTDPAALAKAQDYMLATGMMKQEEKVNQLSTVYNNKFADMAR